MKTTAVLKILQPLLSAALSGAAALAFSGGVQAQGAQPAPDRPDGTPEPANAVVWRLPSAADSARLFERLDRDRDGYLSEDELATRQGDWVVLDGDGDGRISRPEFRALR